MSDKKLQIGYVWQYEAAENAPVSATMLHVQAVLSGFKRHGHKVRMVTYRQGQPHWSDDLEQWYPIGIPSENNSIASQSSISYFERGVRRFQQRLHLPFFRLFDSYRFSQACAFALADCDVLYERFWLLAYGGLLAANRLKKPLIYEVNGDLFEEYRVLKIKLSRLQMAANHFVTRQMFHQAARVVTVSQPLRERMIARWKLAPNKVTVVSNGADINLFISKDQSDDSQEQLQIDLKARYGLPSNVPLVMFVGNFKPWHGVDLLVDAFARLADPYSSAKLVLVGDGQLRPDVEDQVKQLGLASRVVFTGSVPHLHIPAFLRMAQVTVVNPRYSPAALSGSPLKLFEYMAAGKAIVAPSIPNIQQVLVNRQNALLIPPDQPDALASAIAELLENSDLREKLGEAARKRAIQHYSWDRTVSDLETIFDEELETIDGSR